MVNIIIVGILGAVIYSLLALVVVALKLYLVRKKDESREEYLDHLTISEDGEISINTKDPYAQRKFKELVEHYHQALDKRSNNGEV